MAGLAIGVEALPALGGDVAAAPGIGAGVELGGLGEPTELFGALDALPAAGRDAPPPVLGLRPDDERDGLDELGAAGALAAVG